MQQAIQGGVMMSNGAGLSKTRTGAMDRRGARRYTLDWVVKLIAEGSVREIAQIATLQNLSSTGALTSLQTRPRLGEKVIISFKLPFEGESWMRYSATVVRVEKQTNGVNVAVKFDNSRPEFT